MNSSRGEKIDWKLDNDQEEKQKKPWKVSFNPQNESPSKDQIWSIQALGLETGKNINPDEFNNAKT